MNITSLIISFIVLVVTYAGLLMFFAYKTSLESAFIGILVSYILASGVFFFLSLGIFNLSIDYIITPYIVCTLCASPALLYALID